VESNSEREEMRIIILFYQSRWRAYTIYITDGKRIQGKQHFRSPVRALNYVNELIAQGHTVSSPENLRQLQQEARNQPV
jgi:hypothetical protein